MSQHESTQVNEGQRKSTIVNDSKDMAARRREASYCVREGERIEDN